MSKKSKQAVYLSFDIEADGPSPQSNNMLSIGIVGFVKTAHGNNIVADWQSNILPLDNHKADQKTMDEFWAKVPEMWKFVNTNQVTATDVIKEITNLYKELAYKYHVVWVAWPGAYDWQWLNYYYQYVNDSLNGELPYIGFQAKCISTMFWVYTNANNINGQAKNDLFTELCEGNVCDHNPNHDAHAQGIAFMNLANKLNITL